MIPVVLSGGSGTRLWPVSRASMPKQFAELFDESLMVKTLKRLKPFGSPWVITVESMRTLTERTFQDLQIPKDQILFEPMGRNTAPAIALLCKMLEDQGKQNEIVGIFPSDHLIQKEDIFKKALHAAETAADQGALVTLGIHPTYAATGYGYIEVGDELIGKPQSGVSVRKTQGFKEKPTDVAAKDFVDSGRYYWNAGIFIFKVEAMIRFYETYAPEIWKGLKSLKADLSNLREIYPELQSISIDYAIAEKVPHQVCVAADLGWSDVGSWEELAKVKGSATDRTIEIGSNRNFVFSSQRPDRTYALVGVEDLMIVDSQDCLLVAKNGSSQRVKEVVEILAKQGKKEATEHMFEIRPWGKFEILSDTTLFKAKVITVEPGQQLSYQSHAKRAEHWVIISGSPEVVLNDGVLKPKAGEAVYIPVGMKHRIRNPGKEKVLFVEVQVGSYFGEDDIVRYQDDYRRV